MNSTWMHALIEYIKTCKQWVDLHVDKQCIGEALSSTFMELHDGKIISAKITYFSFILGLKNA